MNESSLRDMIAGTIGGVVGTVAGHPQDKIKARLQLHPRRYRSSFDCFLQIVKAEGPLSLFRGLTPPVVSSALMNGILFGSYSVTGQLINRKPGSPLTMPQVAFAGSLAGFVQCLVASPLELAKIRVQVDETPMRIMPSVRRSADKAMATAYSPTTTTTATNATVATTTSLSSSSSTKVDGPYKVLGDIYRRRGVRGVYRGLSILILRDVPSLMAYFVFYEYMLRLGAEKKWFGPSATTFVAGGFAGVASWTVVYPLDVAKTKMQSNDTSTLTSSLREVARAPVRQMFAGLSVTMARAFFVNGVTFFVYEACRKPLFVKSMTK